MSEAEKAHAITDNVYKNILDNFNPGLKQLLSLGRSYQKAMHNVAMAAKSFVDCLTKLGEAASNGKGGVNDIGNSLLQIADVYKEINASVIDNIKVFHAELLIPLETKQENDFKQLNLVYKKYSTGHKFHAAPFEKAQAALKKQKRKNKTKFGFDEKEMQYTREVKEYQAKLEEYHIQSLRTALIEERKRYCFLLDRMCAMIRNNAAHHSKSHDLLTGHMTEWTRMSRRPNILPQSSEALIQSFRILQYQEEDVYNVPDEERAMDNMDTGSLAYGSSNGNPAQDLSGSGDSGTYSGFITVTIPSPPNERPMVKALYNHTGNNDTQLSFNEGDQIALIGERKDGWQYGENTRLQRMGWFPLAFTQPIASGGRRSSGVGHQRVKSLGDISASGLQNQMPDELTQMRERSQTMADVRPGQEVYGHHTLPPNEYDNDSGNHHHLTQHASEPPHHSPPAPPVQQPHVHFNMATTPNAQQYHHHEPNSVPLPPPPPPVPENKPTRPPALQRYYSNPPPHAHGTPQHRRGHLHDSNMYNQTVPPPGSAAPQHSHSGPAYLHSGSPANSSSGYSGGSNRNGSPNYQHGFREREAPSGGFPPPPPNLGPPPAPPGSAAYGHHKGHYHQGNPFSNVKLKKAVSNDRSAPRIYMV